MFASRLKQHDKARRAILKLVHQASPNSLRIIGALCITLALLNSLRIIMHGAHHPHLPSSSDVQTAPLPFNLVRSSDVDSVPFLYRPSDHNCPPEQEPPPARLYATGSERCFALGVPDQLVKHVPPGQPASFWQVNSRALCYSPTPVCLYGRKLQYMLTFQKRGAGKCSVMRVGNNHLMDMRSFGGNESCAAFRFRQVVSIYAQSERFEDYHAWEQYTLARQYSNPRRHAITWESKFAIVVPQYEWSSNICHYSRIWNFIIYVIRHLHLFVPDAQTITHIDVKFRAGNKYASTWSAGLRNATLPLLQKETGKVIEVGKIRKDILRDFQCIHRGIILGREGRVDSFPFLNDSAVYDLSNVESDAHWPTIPHDALWLREAVYKSFGLPTVGEYSGSSIDTFHSIPVPPRRVAILRRAVRSRRRLTQDAQLWLDALVAELARKYEFQVVELRFSGKMSLAEQVEQVRHIGVAIGVHGANLVNTIFMPPGGSLFEIFPFQYVRFYYAGGSNSGLRYSYHEPLQGERRNCKTGLQCVYRYREARIFLSDEDRSHIYRKVENAFAHVAKLHRKFPSGVIPLRMTDNYYEF